MGPLAEVKVFFFSGLFQDDFPTHLLYNQTLAAENWAFKQLSQGNLSEVLQADFFQPARLIFRIINIKLNVYFASDHWMYSICVLECL